MGGGERAVKGIPKKKKRRRREKIQSETNQFSGDGRRDRGTEIIESDYFFCHLIWLILVVHQTVQCSLTERV